MNKVISFKANKEDTRLIYKIVKRAIERYELSGIAKERQPTQSELLMDITACHCNGTPLDLPKFLAADDFNFFHDVVGINRHINRHTGALENCFLPRCAQPEKTVI